MKRPEPDSPEAQQRSAAAAEWLVRCDRGLGAAEQDAFLEWLAADARHGEWLALHRETVGNFSALAQWRPEHSAEPNPDLLAPPRAKKIHWLAPSVLAAAAAVALLLAFFAWRGAPAGEAGPLARRLLEDGSAVELNRGARLRDSFSAQERRVVLESGEAYFTVAKNPERPFVVRAGGVKVRAVGTAFSVRLDSGSVEVLVTEGRVDVRQEAALPAGAGAAAEATLVDAGQKATVSRTGSARPEVTAATPAQIARHLGWQPQLLDFSSAPLALAVAEFNRRNHTQIEIADAELAALPIVASIRSDNVEGFAQFLASAPGVQIERRGDVIVVRRKR
jgi:transmembrane sensor